MCCASAARCVYSQCKILNYSAINLCLAGHSVCSFNTRRASGGVLAAATAAAAMAVKQHSKISARHFCNIFQCVSHFLVSHRISFMHQDLLVYCVVVHPQYIFEIIYVQYNNDDDKQRNK